MQVCRRLKSFSEIVEKYENYIVDFDGTVWSGPIKYEDAFKTLNILKEIGKNIIFVTNSSHKSRKAYQEKLKKFGFESPLDKIYNATLFALLYIKQNYPSIKKLYIIGMDAVVEEATRLGYKIVGGPEHNDKKINTDQEFLNMPVDQDIDGVILAFDMHFNYYKLAYASVCLQKDIPLFVTNADSYDNVGNRNLPEAGCSLSALEKASNKKGLILGKPHPFGLEYILNKYQLDPTKTLMVGDNLNTDVLFGKNGGVDTLALLTGVTSEEGFEKQLTSENPIVPTYLVKNLALFNPETESRDEIIPEKIVIPSV